CPERSAARENERGHRFCLCPFFFEYFAPTCTARRANLWRARGRVIQSLNPRNAYAYENFQNAFVIVIEYGAVDLCSADDRAWRAVARVARSRPHHERDDAAARIRARMVHVDRVSHFGHAARGLFYFSDAAAPTLGSVGTRYSNRAPICSFELAPQVWNYLEWTYTFVCVFHRASYGRTLPSARGAAFRPARCRRAAPPHQLCQSRVVARPLHTDKRHRDRRIVGASLGFHLARVETISIRASARGLAHQANPRARHRANILNAMRQFFAL